MAERAGVKHLVFTHLIPALDTPTHGPFEVSGAFEGGLVVFYEYQLVRCEAKFAGFIHQ